MKVKAFVLKTITETVECEIDDRFRQLAVPLNELTGDNIPELVDECMEAMRKATKLPWSSDFSNDDDLDEAKWITGTIDAIYSAENDELMIEA